MFFDSIFIVNLVRRPDRWKSIASQLSPRKNFPANLIRKIDAYDGSLFTTQTIEKSHLVSPVGMDRYKNLSENQKVWGMDLSAGGIGCALSHAEIWCAVVEENLQRALVLEDDTVLSDDFLENSKRVFENVPEDWESVFLSGLDPEGQCEFLRVKKIGNDDDDDDVNSKNENSSQRRFICRVPRIYRTTNCYVINAKGARNYLKHCVPFTFQLDTAMTTMLVQPEQQRVGSPVDSSLEEPKSSKKTSSEMQNLRNEYVSLIASYCVDPPLAAQATRFGTDIQWKNPSGEHDVVDEEKSRFKAAGIDV